METSFDKANQLLKEAYRTQISGNVRQAIRLYDDSIANYPTATGYTFRALAYSFLGEYELAIEDCQTAINLNSSYGNPYNDMGAYLMKLGREDEAIDYLEKAIVSEQYETRYFAHYNLGNIFENQDRLFEALGEYARALKIEPKYTLAIDAHRALTEKIKKLLRRQ